MVSLRVIFSIVPNIILWHIYNYEIYKSDHTIQKLYNRSY